MRPRKEPRYTIYNILYFLSKSSGKPIPSRFPKGAPMERYTHLLGIFTSLSIYFFNISFGVPSKGALPPGLPHGVPSEKNAPFLETSFIHHSKYPVYERPPPLLIPGSPRTYKNTDFYQHRCGDPKWNVIIFLENPDFKCFLRKGAASLLKM